MNRDLRELCLSLIGYYIGPCHHRHQVSRCFPLSLSLPPLPLLSTALRSPTPTTPACTATVRRTRLQRRPPSSRLLPNPSIRLLPYVPLIQPFCLLTRLAHCTTFTVICRPYYAIDSLARPLEQPLHPLRLTRTPPPFAGRFAEVSSTA